MTTLNTIFEKGPQIEQLLSLWEFSGLPAEAWEFISLTKLAEVVAGWMPKTKKGALAAQQTKNYQSTLAGFFLFCFHLATHAHSEQLGGSVNPIWLSNSKTILQQVNNLSTIISLISLF